MDFKEAIKPTPWNSVALAIDCYEIQSYTESSLKNLFEFGPPGHYTIRVKPESCKKLLHDFKFYYCDTLIDLCCKKNSFKHFEVEQIKMTKAQSLEKIIATIAEAFHHNHFHRDFNIDTQKADLRYKNWLQQQAKDNQLYEIHQADRYTGFVGAVKNRVLLQATEQQYRGQGIGKASWSMASKKIFDEGFDEAYTNISATNLAVANTLTSLGFKFQFAEDIYHCIIRK